MKKFFSVLLVLINISCFGQTSKWFVSFSINPAIGGPSASLKSQMRAQQFDDDAISTFVIFGSGTTHYPRGGATAFLMRGGKKLSDYKSLYFVAGISESATVEGFRAQGWSDGIFGLFAGTYGEKISISYSIYELTAGYQYSFSNTRSKIGFGPSLFLFHYSNNGYNEQHSSVVPGASFTARVPLGREKKLVGFELVLEGNLAPPVKMKYDHTDGFRPGSINMIHANAGLALSFRK
jgi:hypothetical protein